MDKVRVSEKYMYHLLVILMNPRLMIKWLKRRDLPGYLHSSFTLQICQLHHQDANPLVHDLVIMKSLNVK